MLKILPGTRAHIWCNWIYYCHWFVVHRLCHGRAASRTASVSWGKWSWSAGWDYQVPCRFWVLQQGKRLSAWIQTTQSSSSRKLRLIHGTRFSKKGSHLKQWTLLAGFCNIRQIFGALLWKPACTLSSMSWEIQTLVYLMDVLFLLSSTSDLKS